MSDKKYTTFVKGSPEMIKKLSRPDTVPADFDSVMNEYTVQGYRMIAFGYKDLENMNYLKIQKIDREKAECDLIFLGFLITENKLKEATKATIKTLNECKIRTIMATGDNTLTAISVAKHCNILEEDQVVFYGDLENNKLIWKRAETLEDNMGGALSVAPSLTLNETYHKVDDPTANVPWESMVDDESIGVAINGPTFQFLLENIDKYEVVLLKILAKA
jgi:cation-transporting ATPase 13A3/4/5